MKDANPENRPKLRYFRYALISFTAFLVLSLGFSLIRAEPPVPADPPFSEQARIAALDEALDLRAAAERLAANSAASGAAHAAAVETSVTLLTLQARALLSPSETFSVQAASAPASLQPGLQQSAGAAPAAPSTLSGLASALSASGVQRLADAIKADGGMARLLAGAGTAQLLAAENVAAAGGIALETLPHAAAGKPASGSLSAAGPAAASPASPTTGPACPTVPEAPSGLPTAGASASAGREATGRETHGQETPGAEAAAPVGSALSAAVAAEQESVYAYQAALPRLPAKDAGAARAFLAEHEDLASEAAAQSRAACSAAQAQQPGYILEPGFLAAPAAGLARLELESLTAFGDIIALADGGTRDWAVDALQAAARRAAHWGGDPGPVPGILLDRGRLPDLPASPTAAPAGH